MSEKWPKGEREEQFEYFTKMLTSFWFLQVGAH